MQTSPSSAAEAPGLDIGPRFEALHAELLRFVRDCPAEGWRAPTADEGWGAGVTAHHVGAIHYPVIDQAQAILDGRPLTVATRADIDRLNDEHIREQADCTPGDTIRFLALEGERVRTWLATTPADALERTADIPFMGGPTTVGRLLEVVLIDLAEGHLRSARAAAGVS
jgi:hypothetical protein